MATIAKLSGKQIALVIAALFGVMAIFGALTSPPPEPAPAHNSGWKVEEGAVSNPESGMDAVEKAEYTFAVETTPGAVYTLFIDGDMVLYESTGPDMVTRKFDTEDEYTVIILDQKTDFGEVVLTIMDEDRNIVGQIKTTADESHWGGTVQLGR